MTVTANDNRRSYAGNGTTNSWSFPIYFFNASDLKVIRRAADGTETTLVLATDYTVSGAGNSAGGSVTPVAATTVGATYIIYRDPPLTQIFTATDGSKLPIASLVQALDKVVMLTQRLYERVGRSLRLKESDTDGSGRYDVNGNRLVNAAAPVDGSDLITKTWAENTLVIGAGKVSGLATVATSGAYGDLTGKPTLGTAAALNTGTSNGSIPVLGASGLPAVGGSLLTGLSKAQVGLGNVDNTADSAKPISVLQQAALDLKASTSSLGTAAYLNTGTASGNIPLLGASGLPAVGGSLLTGLTKAQVGLANVDNTSDATKNAATATLTNKTLTAPVINSPTGIVKGDVGLGNVDNTSDAAKNAATATLTNKTLTAPVINSPTGLVKADVGLGNVDNTSDAGKPISTATQTALNAKAPLNSPVLVTPTLSAHPAPSDNSFLIADTKWVNDAIAGAVASGVADGDKGDIVVTGSGTIWTLDAGTASALKDRANHTGTQSADTITDGTTNKAYSAPEKTKLAGIASGATANTGTVTSVGLSLPTGLTVSGSPISASGTLSAVWAAGYRPYTDTEATKLSGIATAATANSSDATLLNRANHTGVQAVATLDASAFGAPFVVGRTTGSGNMSTMGLSSSATASTLVYRDGSGMFVVNNATASGNPVNKSQMDAVTAASLQLAVEDQVATGGASVNSKALGTAGVVSSGTVTPDPGDRDLQHYQNNGAHTLAPGSVTGSYLLDITNGASAGAITTSGWTKVSGDAFTTTSGNKFRCHCSVANGGSLLQVQAMQ